MLKGAGVPDHQLCIIPKEYKTKTLAFAFDWLHEVYMSEAWEKTARIWKSVSPEIWERYELLGVTDLTEQRLLIEEGKKLLRVWKSNRPRLFINRQKEECAGCDEVVMFVYSDDFKKCSNCNLIFEVNDESDTDS